VLAAGDGVVTVAGGDLAELFGPIPNFYGRLVVIEHDQTYAGQPIYTLYGHLRSLEVRVGQRVTAGDRVGEVGSAGVAIGPHLHFEVRVGDNTYDATRNPELWLLPLPYNGRPNGAIAGRVLDRDGNPIPELTVAIRPISTESDQPRNRFIQTYSGDPTLNPDDHLQENFAIGDMPRGQYSVSVSTTKFYQQNITVRAGEVTLVTFIVNRPEPTPVVSETPTGFAPTPTAAATAEVTPAETQTGEVTANPEAAPTETPTPAP
jgi:murein DD-endopeptidase MepM/ murein hydrolase activator NlpD